MIKNQILIRKLSGDIEPFSYDKLKRSLKNAGASQEVINTVVAEIEKKLKSGMSTKEIYRLAYSFLRGTQKSLAARYSLKKAIFQMGPQGYPFERFVGKILKRSGYAVEVSKIIQGMCVDHEVDVVARKENKHFMIECKFHNQQGVKSDVKVALYIKARFDDIQSKLQTSSEHQTMFHQAWLVTNTKFTRDAIQYANCVKMKIIGWSHPKDKGLKNIIERSGLHPLTCLTGLSSFQKKELLQRGIVLCQEVRENQGLLNSVGVGNSKQEEILNEIKQVCRQQGHL